MDSPRADDDDDDPKSGSDRDGADGDGDGTDEKDEKKASATADNAEESDEENGDDDDADNVDPAWTLAEELKRFVKFDASKPADKFSDVTFLVGPRAVPFHAHRIILAAASPVFAAMLYPNPIFDTPASGGSAAASASATAASSSAAVPAAPAGDNKAASASAGLIEEERLTIAVKDVEPRVFGQLLTCVYTNTAEVDVKNVSEAMTAATKYGVEKMSVVCASFLEDGMRVGNAAELFQTGAQLVGDAEFGLKFIADNAKAVVESKGFLDLTPDRVAVLVKCDELRIKEVDLWTAVLRWGKAQVRSASARGKDLDLKDVLAPIVPFVRFPLMSVQDFASTVMAGGSQVLSQQQTLELYTYIAQKESKVSAKHLAKVPFSSEPRAPTCFAFRWGQHGRNGRLDHLAQALTGTAGGYCCALGSEPMKPKTGVYYWEIRVTQHTAKNDYSIGLGVAQQSLGLDNYMTNAYNAWCYYNHGIKSANPNETTQFGGRYGVNDTIGFLYDSDAGSLTAYRNRQKIGVMYEGLNAQVLFPSAMVYTQGTAITLVADAVQPGDR